MPTWRIGRTPRSTPSPRSSRSTARTRVPEIALKYGQAIFEFAAVARHESRAAPTPCATWQDRQKDLELTRTGLDAVFNGPDGRKGTSDDFDAILFPRNDGAGAPAKAGYPSIVVPGGFAPGRCRTGAPFPAGFDARTRLRSA